MINKGATAVAPGWSGSRGSFYISTSCELNAIKIVCTKMEWSIRILSLKTTEKGEIITVLFEDSIQRLLHFLPF